MTTRNCEADEPRAPNQRRFSLNSDEAYEALCPRAERRWIPNGALPREPRWARADDGVWVDAETHDAAVEAFGDWRGRVEAGRVGSTR
jgi:hypothetical protein